ncbi:hypothetical protein [Fusobacterium animalis]|uniref:hypothetical protein n=1 Tax=Fusobacterium animalis TaxID=76859 RepID=UPI0030CF0FF0
MWRDKVTKKPVYAQITYFHYVNKNGDFEMCFKTINLYNCETWRYPVKDLEELKRRAEWVDKNVEM